LGILWKKRKKERKKNKRKRTNVPLKIKRDLAAQVSSQNLQVSKRGIWNFSKELSIHHHHPFTPLKPLLLYSLFIHLPPPTIQPIHMHILIWLYDLFLWIHSFDYAIYVSLPTYELHISLLEVGWEREGIMLLCYQKYHIFWEERKDIHHNCLGEDPEIPQRRDLEGSYIGISEFYFWKSCKTSE
jgi:hypothetical protein